MASHMKLNKIKEKIQSLKHNLSVQNIPMENFTLVFRYNLESKDSQANKQFVYIHEENEVQIISEKELRKKSELFTEIFAKKADRDFIITCQPKYALAMIAKQIDVQAVLDDLPQIIGIQCKICNGNNNEEILKTLKKHDACLLDNYKLNQNCLLALAPSFEQVIAAVLIVEKSSQAMLEAEIIGGAKKLSKRISRNYRKAYLSQYSKMNKNIKSLRKEDYVRELSDQEISLRQDLVDYGNLLVKENLVQGTWGNLSLRLDHRYMLITPSGMAYERLTPYDMVRVDYKTMEHEGPLKPSVEKGFHAAVYREHSAINTMIHTHSFNSSVFAAANRPLPVILPEAMLFLGHKTGYVPYFKPGTKELAQAVANSITDDVWCTIMGSHGLASCGKSLSDVFERTMLMEKAARYYLDIHKN